MHDPLNERRPFPILTVVLALLVAILGFSLVAVVSEYAQVRAALDAAQSAQ